MDIVDEVKDVFDTIFSYIPGSDEKVSPLTTCPLRPTDLMPVQSQTEFYAIATMALMKLKVSSRNLHAKLDENRKSLETKKVSIDQLQLSYENVLYRKAHLNRQISACKDLPTPNLSEIEGELGASLGTHTHSPDLAAITTSTIATMQEEMDNRIALKRKLDTLHGEHQKLTEVLDKKRKFLLEVPRRVAFIKVAAVDLQQQFQSEIA